MGPILFDEDFSTDVVLLGLVGRFFPILFGGENSILGDHFENVGDFDGFGASKVQFV